MRAFWSIEQHEDGEEIGAECSRMEVNEGRDVAAKSRLNSRWCAGNMGRHVGNFRVRTIKMGVEKSGECDKCRGDSIIFRSKRAA